MSGRKTSLSVADQQRIFDLAEPTPDGRRLASSRIATILGRSRSAVAWFMYVNGLKRPRQCRRPATYERKGRRLVRFFTEDEDKLILAMRENGATSTAIAAAIAERFGYTRRPHGIRTRLIMLACFEAEAEDRAAAQPQRRAA